jgi:hypothetical protein
MPGPRMTRDRSGLRHLHVAVPVGIARADIPTQCRILRRRLDRSDAFDVVCEVGEPPDLVTVEALLRLQLTAARSGARLLVRDPSPALRELLELCGLSGVVRAVPGGHVEPRREAEQRKQACRVEEERDPGDAIA